MRGDLRIKVVTLSFWTPTASPAIAFCLIAFLSKLAWEARRACEGATIETILTSYRSSSNRSEIIRYAGKAYRRPTTTISYISTTKVDLIKIVTI